MNSKNELPPIENQKIKDYVTPSQNKFYFYLRLKKPLKLVEPTRIYVDNSLTLTKLQKAKFKALKMQMKKLKKENMKKYNNSSYDLNRYKYMVPLKIWNKCQKTYNECKYEYNLANHKNIKKNLNINITKNLSMKNLNNRTRTNNKTISFKKRRGAKRIKKALFGS